MKKLIFADDLKETIHKDPHFEYGNKSMGALFESLIDAAPDVSEDVQIVNAAVLNHFVEAAYKAGQEGRPLMVALNEVEK